MSVHTGLRAARTLIALFVLLAFATVAAAAALAGDGALPPELQDVRPAVARYHSFEQAQSDGYALRSGEPCVRSPLGTMGYHVANAALMADDAIDPLRPELLLYTADQNGNLKLVGVEYWKRDSDGSLATADDRPTLFGQPFDGRCRVTTRRCRSTTTCMCGSPRRTQAACSRCSTRGCPAMNTGTAIALA